MFSDHGLQGIDTWGDQGELVKMKIGAGLCQ